MRWGLTNLLLGLSRCTTNVLARTFDAESRPALRCQGPCSVFVVVPVMLSRILALPAAVLDGVTTPDLRVIASSGSALGSRLTTEVLDRFGPVLYNLYGSTEVAIATVANPADLRQAPSTAGRVTFGVQVEILDDHGELLPTGSTGRGLRRGDRCGSRATRPVGARRNVTACSRRGISGTSTRPACCSSTGGDDDKIVSGGENVFPIEVEELLGHHPDISEVAVVGVPDERFGQALVAFVVTHDGADLAAGDVQAYVRDHLARHKVPRQVEFIAELPRNTTGKILRRSLIDAATAD